MSETLAALKGLRSIALDDLGNAYMELGPGKTSIPLHASGGRDRGTLDSLPHNGALALCGLTHRESYFDMVMVAIIGAMIALVALRSSL